MVGESTTLHFYKHDELFATRSSEYPNTAGATVTQKKEMRHTPITLRRKPGRIICETVRYPLAYATAFGGVAFGSINASEHASVAGSSTS